MLAYLQNLPKVFAGLLCPSKLEVAARVDRLADDGDMRVQVIKEEYTSDFLQTNAA
jgi:hypothetical protein